jgi:hypothetical protein
MQSDRYDSILRELIELAKSESFPHVQKLLARLIAESKPEISDLDADQLRAFARFISDRGELSFPYWSDTREPFVQAHEDEVLELMNGLYGKFACFLLDELGIAVGSSDPCSSPYS